MAVVFQTFHLNRLRVFFLRTHAKQTGLFECGEIRPTLLHLGYEEEKVYGGWQFLSVKSWVPLPYNIMKLSRDATLKIHFIIDQCIPPIIRDSKWFMKILLKLAYKDKAHIFMEFKNKAMTMTEKQFSEVYRKVGSVLPERETDLNNDCVKTVLKNIIGKTVLDVGCGRCFLAEKLSKRYKVTALDMITDNKLIKKYPQINFKKGNIEILPFKDKEFDTVICTATLEHTRNIFQAIKELRRVTKKRLIIAGPKQRPYKYTFDFHLHFFPYEHSLLAYMGTNRRNLCKNIGGDLFYMEDMG